MCKKHPSNGHRGHGTISSAVTGATPAALADSLIQAFANQTSGGHVGHTPSPAMLNAWDLKHVPDAKKTGKHPTT